jgi:hypothetical protein
MKPKGALWVAFGVGVCLASLLCAGHAAPTVVVVGAARPRGLAQAVAPLGLHLCPGQRALRPGVYELTQSGNCAALRPR